MKRKLQSLVVLATTTAGSAMAAVPEGVTTAMTDMKADAILVATGFLVAIIGLAAFKLMRRGV